MRDRNEIQNEAGRILASTTLASSPQLIRLLRYIIAKLASPGELKETVIGIEVFNRNPSDYDPRADPVVRVMAGRLRRKIDEYYRGEGRNNAVRMELPKGSYVPRLLRRDDPSIAVLCLDNLTGDPGQDYLSGALTEALTMALARLPGLRVISRTSAAAFRDRKLPLCDIGAALGVAHIIEGSVSRAGGTVRVTVQLLALPEEGHLWAGTFDRELCDVLALQDEIARSVAAEVGIRLGAPPSPQPAPKVAPEAWLSFARGAARLDAGDPAKALPSLDAATRIDPGFALAHVALAECCFFLEAYHHRKDLHFTSRVAARRALTLDPSLAEAHAAMAAVLSIEWEWKEAMEHLHRAVLLNPHSSLARRRSGITHAIVGELDAAIEQGSAAVALDPVSPVTGDLFGYVLTFAGRYDEAEQRLLRVVETTPGYFPAYVHLAVLALTSGRAARARPWMEAMRRHFPEEVETWVYSAALWGCSGHRAQSDEALRNAVHRMRTANKEMHFNLAIAECFRGHREEAIASLEKACDEREWKLGYLRHPMFGSLSDQPRFQSILRRVGL